VCGRLRTRGSCGREGQAALAGLEAAERRDVDVRAFGDLLEGQPPLGAQLSEPSADAEVDAEFYAAGRDELGAYPTVELRSGEVVGGERDGVGLVLELADGSREVARRVLLATGMDYRFPELPGIEERWGRSVFHCPFCHGWEVHDERLGVLDRGPTGVHRALLLRVWSDDVTLLADGPAELDAEDTERLRAAGVTVEERRVEGLRGPDATLTAIAIAIAIAFADGAERPLGGLLVPVTLHQRSALAEQLGAAAADPGPLAADAVQVEPMFRASVPGVSAAGDVSAAMPSVANAVAAGSTAAAMIVGGLMAEARGLLPPSRSGPRPSGGPSKIALLKGRWDVHRAGASTLAREPAEEAHRDDRAGDSPQRDDRELPPGDAGEARPRGEGQEQRLEERLDRKHVGRALEALGQGGALDEHARGQEQREDEHVGEGRRRVLGGDDRADGEPERAEGGGAHAEGEEGTRERGHGQRHAEGDPAERSEDGREHETDHHRGGRPRREIDPRGERGAADACQQAALARDGQRYGDVHEGGSDKAEGHDGRHVVDAAGKDATVDHRGPATEHAGEQEEEGHGQRDGEEHGARLAPEQLLVVGELVPEEACRAHAAPSAWAAVSRTSLR